MQFHDCVFGVEYLYALHCTLYKAGYEARLYYHDSVLLLVCDFVTGSILLVCTFRGLRKLAGRYWKFGAGEMYRRFVLRATLKKLRQYVPEITIADISR